MAFSVIDDSVLVLKKNGLFKQTKMYRCTANQRLYAGYSGGFIGLYSKGGTTISSVTWEQMELPDVMGAVSGHFQQLEWEPKLSTNTDSLTQTLDKK